MEKESFLSEGSQLFVTGFIKQIYDTTYKTTKTHICFNDELFTEDIEAIDYMFNQLYHIKAHDKELGYETLTIPYSTKIGRCYVDSESFVSCDPRHNTQIFYTFFCNQIGVPIAERVNEHLETIREWSIKRGDRK